MFNSKVNHMTVIVKGVRDDDYEGRELMMEVVRRNCKMDPRLVSQMVYSIRTYEDGKKKRTDFNVEFEAFGMGGIMIPPMPNASNSTLKSVILSC